MINNYIGEKDTKSFSEITNKLREFCLSKGFREIHTQDRLSILAACEDPETVATYEYAGERWPLPQTGQMWLEYELLTNPELPGVFCVSTSYRNEQNPVPGRHKIIFPMFEFELKGGMAELQKFEMELLSHLGYEEKNCHQNTYEGLAKYYQTDDLKHSHESRMKDDFGEVVFCKEFPSRTSPFWNMKKKDQNYSNKIDIIMNGKETIGSAERSTDKDEMKQEFYTISEGRYAKKLFELFGKDRVEKELHEFLSLPFFPRSGGGIGVARLIDAMKVRA